MHTKTTVSFQPSFAGLRRRAIALNHNLPSIRVFDEPSYCTVSVKLWVAFTPTPFLAVMAIA